MRSDDEDKKQTDAEPSEDAPSGEPEGGAPQQEPEAETEEQEEQEEDDDESPPQITLDRYLSRRRPRSAGWGHLVAAVLMLVTLVLIIVYKDRCGQAVSGLMGEIGGEESKRPPARIELKAPKKSE